MNFKNINKVFFLVTGLLLWILNSCQPNGPANAEKRKDSVLSGSDSNMIDSIYNVPDSSASVYYFLPSPDEIMAEVITTDLDIDLKYINSTANAKAYLQSKQQALNLGVYLSDLAFINIKGDKTSSLEYFKVCRDLSLKLNIYQLFNEKIYDRIQDNIINKDSLQVIFKELYTNLTELLESSKRNNTHALIACGALIETLYLSTISVKSYSEYKTIVTKLFEQKYVIANFYEFAAQYGRDPNVREVLSLLFNLKTIIEDAESKSTERSVSQKDGGFVISGGDDVIVTEEKYNSFKEEVIKSREKIVAIN